MKEKGYVLKTVVNGVDMFYSVCEVEGGVVEEGLVGSFMTYDKNDLPSISVMNKGEFYQPSKDVVHTNLTWTIEEVELKLV